MKKLLLTVMAFVGVVSMNAQIATVESVTPLLKGVESEMYNPVLSADGSRLLFSNCNYAGLRMYDFNDNVVTKVSTEARNTNIARISQSSSSEEIRHCFS